MNDFQIEFDGATRFDSILPIILNATQYCFFSQTSVALETDSGVIHGRPTSTKGKTTTISTPQSLDPKRVKKVTVIGREEATSAQRARNEFVFLVLLGELELHDSPFIQLLWFPRPDNVLKRRERIQGCQLAGFTDMNDSQRGVISRMVADDAPLVIVHGRTCLPTRHIYCHPHAILLSLQALPGRESRQLLHAQLKYGTVIMARRGSSHSRTWLS